MTTDQNTSTTTDSTDATVVFEKGSWRDSLNKSSILNDKSAQAKKRAGVLLWTGATEAIEEWMPNSSDDVNGEGLAGEVLTALGTSRKGDASKIKTVALAVRNSGLILSVYPNLSKAYAEATRLTKTVQAQSDEDDAAEKAIEALADSAPKSATTAESAALILLAKGIDGAVVALLDALGANNEAAHRSFMRAVSTEIAARVQAAKPKPAPKVAGPKAGAKQATTGKAATKAKPSSAKAKPTATSASKGDPNKKALPPKPTASKAKPAQPVTEPVHVGDDVPDSALAEGAEAFAPINDGVETAAPTQASTPVKRRAVPVRKGVKATA